jgi:transposase
MKKKVPSEQSDRELYQLSKKELVEMIKALITEVTRLKEIIERDSTTSSLPPSQDLIKKSEKPKLKQESPAEASKRSRGGQPGHKGSTRYGFARVDRCEILRPQGCESCGMGVDALQTIKVEKQQVAQLVERPIEIVEYHRYTCVCESCGQKVTASWSPDIVPGQDLGLRLQGFLGWLNNYGHLPYEKQQELLWELGQIEIGVGTLVNTNQRIDSAVVTSVNSLAEWIQENQPNIHIDETPWAVKGVKEWLWTFANQDFALFHAADTRSRRELETILGVSYSGVISSDDYSVYIFCL